MRKWKRSLYEWAGEDCPPSARTSRAASRASEQEPDAPSENEEEKKLKPEKLAYSLENPDNMASLLGHFDLNTRQATLLGEESTLKASENRSPAAANAPIDFSQFSN